MPKQCVIRKRCCQNKWYYEFPHLSIWWIFLSYFNFHSIFHLFIQTILYLSREFCDSYVYWCLQNTEKPLVTLMPIEALHLLTLEFKYLTITYSIEFEVTQNDLPGLSSLFSCKHFQKTYSWNSETFDNIRMSCEQVWFSKFLYLCTCFLHFTKMKFLCSYHMYRCPMTLNHRSYKY